MATPTNGGRRYSSSDYQARFERCVEYRSNPGSSLNGWIEILANEYNLSEGQANLDYAKAGEHIKKQKEEERQVYLDSIEAQLDVVHKEAVEGILQVKKDNQNTKKMALSFIKQLQDELDRHPEQIQTIIPILNRLIDTINKSNYNESKVIEIMGKWKGLEQPQTQVNIQNNYQLKWGDAIQGNDPGDEQS